MGKIPEWLIAADFDEIREFVIHTTSPRFIMEIEVEDQFKFAVWIDPEPSQPEKELLMAKARAAMETYDMDCAEIAQRGEGPEDLLQRKIR